MPCEVVQDQELQNLLGFIGLDALCFPLSFQVAGLILGGTIHPKTSGAYEDRAKSGRVQDWEAGGREVFKVERFRETCAE